MGLVEDRRQAGRVPEAVVLAIKVRRPRFAGDDVDRSVFYPEDDRYLVDREVAVSHHEVERPEADELLPLSPGGPRLTLRDEDGGTRGGSGINRPVGTLGQTLGLHPPEPEERHG
jgi:hypothetical protein